MNRFCTPLLAAACLCAALPAQAEVKTDYDHSANFERYHTYS